MKIFLLIELSKVIFPIIVLNFNSTTVFLLGEYQQNETNKKILNKADYTLLQKVFQSEHASSRLDHSSSALEERLGA